MLRSARHNASIMRNFRELRTCARHLTGRFHVSDTCIQRLAIGGCVRWPKALPPFCEAREGDHTLSD